jgi:formylglycine-generating enzyme required for sulfatase activity
LKQRVTQLIERFANTYPNCRYVVSSRVAGYTGLGANYHVATIREFRLADVRQFLLNWYQIIAVNKYGPGHHALEHAKSRTANLVSAIEQNSAIQDLAINPLMLTVIALIHKDLEATSLPSQRAELYEKALDVLIYTWEEAKVGIQQPTIGGRQMTAVQKRLILQTVALQMQENRTREIDLNRLQEILRDELNQLYQDTDDVVSIESEFTKLLEERAGILVARSRGIYGFSHLTFQEYLAGCAIANKNNYIEYTLERVADSWWRETILLEAGYLSLHGREKVSQLVQAIADHSVEPSQYHNTVLALGCINDVGEGGIEAKVKIDVQNKLQKATNLPLEGKEKGALIEAVNIRGLAISALQQAGMGYWSALYGEPEWVTIKAGPFQMGGDGEYEGKLVHTIALPEFQIARVPITNAQYLIFVNDTQQKPPRHWEDGKIPAGLEGHPVVHVSWHDAIRYCDWLSEKTGNRVTLPSEAEWEKAAGWNAVKREKRVFPWGNDFNQYYLNCKELGVGTTTPVGIFEEGSSPYGVLDMSGNAWEWTRSHQKDYPYDPNDGRENLMAGDDVNRTLRGGSFIFYGNDFFRVACRLYNFPNPRYQSYGFRVVCVSSPISS